MGEWLLILHTPARGLSLIPTEIQRGVHDAPNSLAGAFFGVHSERTHIFLVQLVGLV